MLPTKEEFLANGGLAPCSETFNDECAICHADAKENEVEDPVTLPCDCKYTYCRKCILYWLTSDASKAKCPLCKRKFFQTVGVDEDDLDEDEDEDEEVIEPVMNTFGLPVQRFEFEPRFGRRVWGLVGAADPSAIVLQMDDIWGEILHAREHDDDDVISQDAQCQVRLEYLIDALIFGANFNPVLLTDNARAQWAQLAVATYHVLEGMERHRYTCSEFARALVTGVIGPFGVSSVRMAEFISAASDMRSNNIDGSNIGLFNQRVLKRLVRDTRLIAVRADRQEPDYDAFDLPVRQFAGGPWGLSNGADPTGALIDLLGIHMNLGEISDDEQCEVRLQYLVDILIGKSRILMLHQIHWNNDNGRYDLYHLVGATYRALEGMQGQRLPYEEMKETLFQRMLEQLQASSVKFSTLGAGDDLMRFFQGEHPIGDKFCSEVLKYVATKTRAIAIWADGQ